MPGLTLDLGRLIDRQRLTRFQIGIIGWCFLVQLADGYDITAAAFATPTLARQWSLGPGQLGLLFSASLVAGLFGPPLFGFLADRYGRRTMVIAGTVVFGAFSLAAVAATSVDQLIALRFLAGLGMSGALPTAVALTNEFAPRRARATFVIIMFAGATFGGGIPGFVAVWLMPAHGWQILFWIGGLFPLALAACLGFVLPESVKFLLLRPRRAAELERIVARLLPSARRPAGTRYVIADEANGPGFSLKLLLAGRLAWLSPALWVCVLITTMVFYFITNWMPTILAGAGIPLGRAVFATTLFQFGGTLAGLVMRPLDRFGMVPLTVLYVLAIPIVAVLGTPGLGAAPLMALIFAAGFCVLGINFAIIATSGNLYPTVIRSYGVGCIFFFGRGGSVIGPSVAGLLIAHRFSTQALFLTAAAPMVIALIASVLIVPLYRAHYMTAASAAPPSEAEEGLPSHV